MPCSPGLETFDEGRLRKLSEGIEQLNRTLMRRMSDARLLRGETLADLAKCGATVNLATSSMLILHCHGDQHCRRHRFLQRVTRPPSPSCCIVKRMSSICTMQKAYGPAVEKEAVNRHGFTMHLKLLLTRPWP